MRISIYQLRLHNLVFNCIFLITLFQSSLAGLELLFDGKKFFYRSNGRDIPIELSPGGEIIQFHNNISHSSDRKTKETAQYMDQELMSNGNDEEPGAWYSYEDNDQPDRDFGTEIVENELGGTLVEESEPTDHKTRYDLMASLAKDIHTERPEERIDTIISLIREDLERYLNHDPELHL